MSKRSEISKFVELSTEIALNDLLFLHVFGDNDEETNKLEDEILDDALFSVAVALASRHDVPNIQHSVPKYRIFISEILSNFDEIKFRQIIRVSKTNFLAIYDIIKGDAVFCGTQSSLQFSAMEQLIIVLYRLGSMGDGASVAKTAAFFGIRDCGAIKKITKRVFTAFLNVKDKFLHWPDACERQKLVKDTLNELPQCIGYLDTTEIKLAEKPTQNPEAYFSRNHIYSMKVQAVCDHKKIIRHLVLGHPGGIQDSHIFNNCDLKVKEFKYIRDSEWLAADSAYKLTPRVITPFRSDSQDLTLERRKEFNRRVNSYRIRVEHCFGLLKERFNSLMELEINIKNDRDLVESCIWVYVCCILHNIITGKDNNDKFDVTTNGTSTNDENDDDDVMPTPEGEEKRRTICSLLFGN